MNGERFVLFADRIASDPDEAARRSAISRAYYGALHESIAFLSELGIPIDTRHDNAAIDFKSGSLHDSVALGRLLDELRNRRVSADYHLGKSNIADDAQSRYAVVLAKEALQLVSSLRQVALRDEIKQALVQQIRDTRLKTGRRI